jgi:hypothetical protein
MHRFLILKILAKLLTRKVLLKRKLERNPNDTITIDKISDINNILKRIENLKRECNDK